MTAAAFANAISSHSIELDDIDVLALFHFSPPVFSPALALAEATAANGKEMLAATLATIHNERFIVRLVDQMRASLMDGTFQELKKEFLGRYTHKSGQASD